MTCEKVREGKGTKETRMQEGRKAGAGCVGRKQGANKEVNKDTKSQEQLRSL